MRVCARAQEEGQFSTPLSCVNIDTLRDSDAHSTVHVNKGDDVTMIRLHINTKWNPTRETDEMGGGGGGEGRRVEAILYIYIYFCK